MRFIKALAALPFILIALFVASLLATKIIPGFEISSYQVLFNSLIDKNIGAPSPPQLRTLLPAKGFQVTLFADNIPNARMLKISPTGQLLVSSPSEGTIYLLGDQNKNGKADTSIPLITGLNRPHGMDLYHDDNNDWLYIAENHAIGRIAVNWKMGKTVGDYHRLITDLPTGGNHWSKTLRFGPDGWLYLTGGSSCNVCEESDQRRAAMMRFRPDGSGGHIYASGLRNSVGFDWAPWDNSLYATDNGRDLLGDNFPPDELNLIQQDGFYGWPYINGFGRLDPKLGPGKDELLSSSINPSFAFNAHNAPLGIHFFRYAHRPKDYQRSALVALHGSWNRSQPDGYKVIALDWDTQGKITSRDFLSNFLQNDNHIIGRPVDIEEGTDGSIYISDDYAGAIYRVLYQ
jgi:glucose/arabinose dehydrogenase